MLYTEKLLAELERKRPLLASHAERHEHQISAYRAALAALGQRFPSARALAAAQARALATPGAAGDGGQTAPGARPTAEYDRWRAAARSGDVPVLAFGQAFAHHEQARAWAERLRGTTTLAVDGSQLLPWRDASIPLALVQAGLFENPHTAAEPYVKDVVTELLTPDELFGPEADVADARTGEVLGYSERIVHLRRFELEARLLAERMRAHAARAAREERAPRAVAFYDGSLMVSFANRLPEAYRRRYVAAMGTLLAASVASRVPLVGYIDTSYARDIARMLHALAAPGALPDPERVSDAQLWQGQLGWGDRTAAFVAARGDLTGTAGPPEAVIFVLAQMALDRPPARLELPAWVLEAGLLDAVVDVARAEAIVGNGYPYAIEAADAVAVISAHDRAQFYGLFERFAAEAGLSFSISRKAISKAHRRV